MTERRAFIVEDLKATVATSAAFKSCQGQKRFLI
jgi:hypothetical protein